MMRALKGLFGLLTFFAGWALFGYGFEFINDHIRWPMWVMIPLIVAQVCFAVLMVVGGLALVVSGLKEPSQ